jgi:precorrin-6B methylase 2
MNSYELAEKYKMLSPDEVDLIKSCMARLPERPKIINIGANIGTSTCAMLEANKNAYIFSLDTKPCFEERAHLKQCGLPVGQVVRILGDSTKIDTELWPFLVDMVFVDGGHTIEAVTADCENWKPFTRQFMLFHDYNHPNYTKNGVNEFDDTVDELMKDWKRVGQARYLVAFERV